MNCNEKLIYSTGGGGRREGARALYICGEKIINGVKYGLLTKISS